MEPEIYTFTINYKDVSKTKCAFVGHFIPYDKKYERWCDEVGVYEMAMWITNMVELTEKSRLNEKGPIPSSMKPAKSSKRSPQYIVDTIYRKIRNFIRDTVFQTYENYVKSGWDLDEIRNRGYILRVTIPGTGKSKDYTVEGSHETSATIYAVKKLLCSTHVVAVDPCLPKQPANSYAVTQTRITAATKDMSQLMIGFIPNEIGGVFRAVLQYSSFANGITWENIKVRMMPNLMGWKPEDGNDELLSKLLEKTGLDPEALSYIISGLWEGTLDDGDLPEGANCRIMAADGTRDSDTKADTILHLSEKLYVGDPCFCPGDEGCLGCIDTALPGDWKYFVRRDKGIGRPKQIEVRHADFAGKTIKYHFWGTVGVDSGQLGVYDGSLREMIGTPQEFYPIVCRGTLRRGEAADVFNFRGRGVAVSTLHGDGVYTAHIAKEGDQVVGVKLCLG